MENATKALIIAGSILIAILLIAFGMRIIAPATDSVDSSVSSMQTTEMATFNSKFTQYIGVKSRAQVMSLLNTIIANNATSNHQVTVNGNSAQSMMNSLEDKVYTIKIETTDYTGGYISNIQIN